MTSKWAYLHGRSPSDIGIPIGDPICSKLKRTDGRPDGRTGGRTDGRTGGRADGRMDPKQAPVGLRFLMICLSKIEENQYFEIWG